MRSIKNVILISPLLFFSFLFADSPPSWYPQQKTPKIVHTVNFRNFTTVKGSDGRKIPRHLSPDHVLVQSISGLAAKAVNEGKGNEMVWIIKNSKPYINWYELLKKRIGFTEQEQQSAWTLLKHFHKKGLIKGYILYRQYRS